MLVVLPMLVLLLAGCGSDLTLVPTTPSAGERLRLFSDSDEGGRSRARFLPSSEGELQLVYRLDSGYRWPYAGFSVLLGKEQGQEQGQEASKFDAPLRCIDLTNYDSLELRFDTRVAEGIYLQLRTQPPRGEAGSQEQMRMLQAPVPAHSQPTTLRIGMDAFRIPEWWRELYRLPLNPNPRWLERACKLDFVAGGFTRVGVSDTLRIREIRLLDTRSARAPWWLLPVVGTLSAAMALLLVQVWRHRLRRRSRVAERDRGIEGRLPVEQTAVPDFWEVVRNHVQAHYPEAELSQVAVARAIGLSEDRLRQLFRERADTSFRAFLNDLRLAEAKRLLRETDWQITRVALEVGYGSVAHFNRQFRASTGETPGGWRATAAEAHRSTGAAGLAKPDHQE
jgi:AraC-like DNA-binding protein